MQRFKERLQELTSDESKDQELWGMKEKIAAEHECSDKSLGQDIPPVCLPACLPVCLCICVFVGVCDCMWMGECALNPNFQAL